MIWSTILYFLSLLSIYICIYTVYKGRNGLKVAWCLLLVAIDVAAWIIGVVIAREKYSLHIVNIGMNITGIAIAAAFPLMTFYQIRISKQKVRMAFIVLKVQIVISILITLLNFVQRYWRVELINGDMNLVVQKNATFYIFLIYGTSSYLIDFIILYLGFMHSEYKRDIRQAIYWFIYFGIAIVALILWFYFPVSHKYICCFAFFLLFQAYRYSQRYYAVMFPLSNLTEYVYSILKTPLLVLNRDGIVLLANNSATVFFNKNTGGLIGTDMRSLFDFDGGELYFSKTFLTGNRISKFDATVLNNGKKCEIEITYIYDKYNEFLSAIFLINDISNRISLINELEEQKRKAELANKAKSVFLANTSHEIRTPMNAIVGMSELILREEISSEVREYAVGVKQAGANLLSIINDILDFSKIESGKLEIVPGIYHLRSLINDVISIIRVKLFEKPLSFFANIDSTLPNSLIGDEVRVRQILLNLLSNAVKYTETGFIHFSISGERTKIEGDTEGIILTIAVSDSGMGIKKEYLENIFGEFVQVDMTTNKGIEGTGLGLAITRQLCRAMGGDVTVSSVYGEGSIFTARISQRIGGDGIFAMVEQADEKPVLVYESWPVHRESLAWSLENLGVPHTMVSSRDDFVEALNNSSWAFVFLGYDLYESLREVVNTANPRPCIVLLADYGMDPGNYSQWMLFQPVHVLSIANILNNRGDNQDYTEHKEGPIKFTAPSARVLIVDDVITNLKVAEGLMVPYRMIIDICKSGAEAIDLVQKYSYDLIFMDHMMPGMDGIEAANIIRRLEGNDAYYRHIPIIALTANAMSGMREIFMEKGFNDYLPKPIEIFKLNEILERWIPAEKQTIKTRSETERNNADRHYLSFAPIPGIDVGRGLILCGGSAENYRKILSLYQKDAEMRLDQLRNLPVAEDLSLFITQVHALKSASVSIGAIGLSEQAAHLEELGKSGDIRFIEERLSHFCTDLEAIIGAIRTAMEHDSPEKEPSGVPGLLSDAERDALLRLREALETEHIGRIDTLLNELSALPLGKALQDYLDDVSDKALISEFKEAIRLIDKLTGGTQT
ncbi:MAG: response regulator [Spirochaetaceae bacterium]|jgi:signal transduction histidine kinase/AmiR/NasT family two-component response regulator/HPt (histidine-containing phosphotransfer) domain-containing protein|nr:response regulator [Spirochaetaceae bacterium]